MEIETDTEKIVEAEIAENANQIPFPDAEVVADAQTVPDFMNEEE